MFDVPLTRKQGEAAVMPRVGDEVVVAVVAGLVAAVSTKRVSSTSSAAASPA